MSKIRITFDATGRTETLDYPAYMDDSDGYAIVPDDGPMGRESRRKQNLAIARAVAIAEAGLGESGGAASIEMPGPIGSMRFRVSMTNPSDSNLSRFDGADFGAGLRDAWLSLDGHAAYTRRGTKAVAFNRPGGFVVRCESADRIAIEAARYAEIEAREAAREPVEFEDDEATPAEIA